MGIPEPHQRAEPVAASFRDPAGELFVRQDRVFRVVNAQGRENVAALLRSKVAQDFIERGRLIGSRILDDREAGSVLKEIGYQLRMGSSDQGLMVVEHERVAFPSFPYEWSPGMLAAAAQLTLELAEGLLTEGIGLKDGTPYNVLFRGPQPVFVDILSLEPRRREDPVWLPYGQFLRTFLLPLLSNKHFDMPLDQIFLTRRDGLEPEEVYRWCSWAQRLRPPFLGNVTLSTWLAGKAEAENKTLYRERSLSPDKAEYVLHTLFRRLRRALNAATARAQVSRWSDYMERTSTYTDIELATKKEFVGKFLAEFHPAQVLDIGCNTGLYSFLAAESGAAVTATDLDAAVVDTVWERAHSQGKNVLPLVLDFSRPTPATGWRNRECPSFLQRSHQAFDAILMLAVVHHLLVTERVPLGEIISLAAELCRRFLVIEYVGTQDPMFQRLTRGRAALHKDFTQEGFEQECSRHFDLLLKQPVKETYRTLYLWQKRQSA
ncbi:MAG: class I SAM-dependent methyltransferase [Acidobacteriia bacterium]|nr:class I SAM-dependent methyltransferase [Terriglobia bacterium]